jgi:hypothetical protein
MDSTGPLFVAVTVQSVRGAKSYPRNKLAAEERSRGRMDGNL